MRTFSYIMGGRPKNRSDCIDYSSNLDIINIFLSLKSREHATDEHVYKELYAVFVWEFSDTSIAYEETYGNVFFHEDSWRQRKSVKLANERLKNIILRIKERTKLEYITCEHNVWPC